MSINYIEIPTNFFDYRETKEICGLEDGSSMVLLLLKLLLESENYNGKWAIFEFSHLDLNDKNLGIIFNEDSEIVKKAFDVFKEFGLAVRYSRRIETKIFWKDKKERNTNDDKKWRQMILIRDGHKCVLCGNENNLHVHHILPWRFIRDNEKLLKDEKNGITLCKKCHLSVHKGCWRNVSDEDMIECLKKIVKSGR